MIVREGERRVVIATEGGHTDFAPRGDLEEDLLRYLRKEFGRVSAERILAGPGFFNLYRFLRDTGWAKESSEVADKVRGGDPAAVITSHAASEGDPLCVKVVEMFVSIYGAEAGNLALKTLAVGGVVVAGGIAPGSSTRCPPAASYGLQGQGPALAPDGHHPGTGRPESQGPPPGRRRGRLPAGSVGSLATPEGVPRYFVARGM